MWQKGENCPRFSELQRTTIAIFVALLWLCIISQVAFWTFPLCRTQSQTDYRSPQSQSQTQSHRQFANHLIDLCSLFAVVPYLVASFHFVKVRKVNDLIVSFSGFPLSPSIENSSDFSFFLFYLVYLDLSCRVLSRLFARSPVSEWYFLFYLFVCCRREKLLPLRLSTASATCLFAPKENPILPFPRSPILPSLCSQKLLGHNFMGNAHIDCDKRETGIPIAYRKYAHHKATSNPQRGVQCIHGVAERL